MSIVLAALLGAVLAQSQPIDPATQALIRAAMTLRTFDRLADACTRGTGFSTAQQRAIHAWQDGLQVASVRQRVTEFERTPGMKPLVDSTVQTMLGRLRGQGQSDCELAVSVTRTKEGQFADLGAAPAPSAPAAAPTPAPAARPAPAGASSSPAVPAATLEAIDSFGFDVRAGMGFGGFITTEIYPVVLFKNGDVLTDVRGLMAPAGLTAHKAAQPAAWSRWRRAGGELQVEGKKGFEKLPFQATYARLPAGFTLNGLYRRLGGTGTLGVGGTTSVAVYDQYRFFADGRVERDGGAGSRAEAGDVSTVTRGAAATRRGRYTIDGLSLRVVYDDGTSEQRLVITDPKDPKGAIWLDGEGYAQRK